MGHYDDAHDAHYAQQRADRLKRCRPTIVSRLHRYADAMTLLGMNTALIDEAIDHLRQDETA